ncbi:uncharacterized protein LOC115334456 [Aquila chrysaetos chrysaetos]|uniref:uncharacterized protein LOC115334456 n=1 Tax=Aquila chrysaetos chrysaetos TaxID=223781 RepID=UPI001B7D47C8|nr:uncharacterized protein LOC115334456 [Aquila chrysaetos chrysaetos]
MPCLESVLQQPGQTPVCRAAHNHTVTGNSNWLGNRSFCLTSRLLPGLRTGYRLHRHPAAPGAGRPSRRAPPGPATSPRAAPGRARPEGSGRGERGGACGITSAARRGPASLGDRSHGGAQRRGAGTAAVRRGEARVPGRLPRPYRHEGFQLICSLSVCEGMAVNRRSRVARELSGRYSRQANGLHVSLQVWACWSSSGCEKKRNKLLVLL